MSLYFEINGEEGQSGQSYRCIMGNPTSTFLQTS